MGIHRYTVKEPFRRNADGCVREVVRYSEMPGGKNGGAGAAAADRIRQSGLSVFWRKKERREDFGRNYFQIYSRGQLLAVCQPLSEIIMYNAQKSAPRASDRRRGGDETAELQQQQQKLTPAVN